MKYREIQILLKTRKTPQKFHIKKSSRFKVHNVNLGY